MDQKFGFSSSVVLYFETLSSLFIRSKSRLCAAVGTAGYKLCAAITVEDKMILKKVKLI